MVRTSGLLNIFIAACIFSAECRQTINYSTHAQVLSVDVKSLHDVDNGTIVVGEPSQLIIFAKYLPENIQLIVTNISDTAGEPCSQYDFNFGLITPYKDLLLTDYSKLFVYILAKSSMHMKSDSNVWLCYRTDKLSDWIHLGPQSKIPISNRSIGRRHLLRRSLIDDITPPVWDTTAETTFVDNIAEIIHKSELKPTTESGSKKPTRVSLFDKIFASVTRDNDFRTSDIKRSVIGFNDNNETYSTSSDPIVPMNLVEEKNPNGTPTDANRLSAPDVRVFGIRIEGSSKDLPLEGNSILLLAGYNASLRIFGYGLTDTLHIQFSAKKQDYGTLCDVSTSDIFKVAHSGGEWATLNIQLPPMLVAQKRWYLCVRTELGLGAIHQGPNKWLTIKTYTPTLPLWLQGLLIAVLLVLSGIFSGLNLGLMALDKTELKVVLNTGSAKERSYARAIEPVRRHGNFLLCTLLLGNVMVNSTFTILLDNLSTGLIAVIGSTIGIVIFGEIIPQAICSRHGLAIGAKTVWLVRVFMVVTGIISWPVSKILDLALGEELGNTYNRERLKELIRVTQDNNDIREEEQNIICGALELHRKTAREIMTKIDDVFMLNVDASLDFNTINDIMEQGFSRVPIYESTRKNVISVLFIKDLAFIDPDDNTPLRTLSQFYQNPCLFIFEDTTLDVVFKQFKEGNKGHMAFVQIIHNEADCDPFYELVGLVTLEDVIEELIQEEIVDETDVYTDNRTKRKTKFGRRRDFREFYQSNNPGAKKTQISPQMQVAAFQFLRTTVEPFKEEHISEGILKKMLTQDIIHVIKPSVKVPDPSDLSANIYVQGKAADFFVLILEGHVDVKIGKENLNFEGGPFTFFGCSALTMSPPIEESSSLPNQLSRGSIHSLEPLKFYFRPDFTVKAVSEVTFLKIRRSHYIAASRAFLLQKSQKDPYAEEIFEKEMAKILSDEHLSSSPLELSVKEASTKDPLLNGRAVLKCNGEEDMLRKISERKMSRSLTSTPSKEKKCDDSFVTTSLPANNEEC